MMRIRNVPKGLRGICAHLILLAGLTVCQAQSLDPQSVSTRISAALAAEQQSAAQYPHAGRLAEALRSIYAQHGYAPLWSRNGEPTVPAINLLRVLRTAESYGLRSQDYAEALDALPAIVAAGTSVSAASIGSRFDLALSSAALAFLSDVHFGRIDARAAGFDLASARPPLPIDALLTQLATTNEPDRVIASVEPQFYHYALLKRALARYRLLAAGAATPTALERSQAPYARRVRQIELTLERWRWLPAFTSPPIIVNIPQFRLFAFRSTQDRKAEILQMDVIVGRTYPRLQTPVFTAQMQYVIFRPYWDVPQSITQREMLPAMRSNPDYLRQQHLEIVGGSGDAAAVLPPSAQSMRALVSGAARLRQEPGADNALGLIKFMLPNTYNVYLHSTPAIRLFGQSRRAFSHGCIRVSDPVALATYVLRNAPGHWTPESVSAAMHGTATQRVNLTTPIPVLILYGTALAMEDGTVQFFDDIYAHDRRLEKLLVLPPVTGK